MNISMWRFLQKKTKLIMGISIFYVLLLIFNIVLINMNLNIVIFSVFISIHRIIFLIGSIYFFILGIILMYYKLGWKFKILNISYLIISFFILIYFTGFYFVPELKSTRIKTESDVDILLLESKTYDYSIYIFQIKHGIFAKTIAELDQSLYSLPVEVYEVEVTEDGFVIITSHKNDDYYVYIYFEISQDEVSFLYELVMPK